VPEVIRDPILNKSGLGTVAVVGGTGSVASGVLSGVFLAPLTGGTSLTLSAGAGLALSTAAAANAGLLGASSAVVLEERNKPEDVYFHIVYGGSVYDTEWVAKDVSPGSVWQTANSVVQ